MKAKILEIFRSIQGEGPYAGVPQVFVRFFECNMHCVWCDTPNSIGDTTRHYKEMDLKEVYGEIIELSDGCHSVSLTGGEPLLQADFMKELLPLLKKKKIQTYLDTNGIFDESLKKIVKDVDIIAMDIKLPSSTECQPFWNEHKKFLKVAKGKNLFIKAVISSKTEKEDILKSINLIKSADPKILLILQPNYFDMKNGVVSKCVEFQKECAKILKNVRIMPQMHKYLKIR